MRLLAAAVLLAAARDTVAELCTLKLPACVNVTPSVWKDPQCWDPKPPTADDTVVFPSGTSMVNTTWDYDSSYNYTYVEAIVVGGLVVDTGAEVHLVQGTLELRGDASVRGTLHLDAPPVHERNQARNTVNKADLKEDTASRALGLRDCAYTPIGFTPRLCGAGTWTVENGGLLYVSGLYASVFSPVQVLAGGTYELRFGAHPFGLVQNEGTLQVNTVYWHGLLENKAGANATFDGLTFFDEYSHAGEGNDSRPEMFVQEPFINEGNLEVNGEMRSTYFWYHWAPYVKGVYRSSFRNRGQGRLVLKGGSFDTTLINEGGDLVIDALFTTPAVQNNGTLHVVFDLSCDNVTGTGRVNVTGRLNTLLLEASDVYVSGTLYTTTVTSNTLKLAGDENLWGQVMAEDCSFKSTVAVGKYANFRCTTVVNSGGFSIHGSGSCKSFQNQASGWLAVLSAGDMGINTFTNANQTGGVVLQQGVLTAVQFDWPKWSYAQGSLSINGTTNIAIPFTFVGQFQAGTVSMNADVTVSYNGDMKLPGQFHVDKLTVGKVTASVSDGIFANTITNNGTITANKALIVSGNMDSAGTVRMNNGPFQVVGNVTNSGTMSLYNAEFSATKLETLSTFTSNGDVSVHTLSSTGSFTCANLDTNILLSGGSFNAARVHAEQINISHGLFKVANVTTTTLDNHGTFVGAGRFGSIRNEGNLTAAGTFGDLISYVINSGTANLTGTNVDTIENSGDLYVRFATPELTRISQVNATAGSRTLLTGNNTEINQLSNGGIMVFDSIQVWVHRVECDSCNFFLADEAELHFMGATPWKAPRGMLRVQRDVAERGTPAVCTHNGACHPDPCPYEGHSMTDRCFVNDTIPGVLYFVAEKEFCYTCTHGHPLGTINDAKSMQQLGAVRLEISTDSNFTSPRPRRLALAPVYSFKRATVESDGTGALVMTTALHLHGDDALKVKRTRVHALTEHSRPVFVGGGRLTLQKRSELRLGLEAILDGGGSIDALPGTAVIVEHFASVVARNHSLRVAKGAKMRVDGTMHFHKHSTVESCGRSVGAGTLVMDDPAESARTCAEAATCLAECKTDADCGSGLCSWCTAAHSSDVQGICVEPGCQTDDDCNLNGQCRGGTCASCDSSGLPFVGPHCTELRPSSGIYDIEKSWNPITGDRANATYSGFGTTYSPTGCELGGPDDFVSYGGVHRLISKARNLKKFGSVVFFDYTYPPSACNWTLGICAGLGTGGCQCNRTSASDCGCPPSCTTPTLPPGMCPSYITATTNFSHLGDCGPRDAGCFCGREFVQTVQGTKGCPSNVFSMPAGGNSTDVLLYYNMGDGKSVGLATGPPKGPWTVVKEPVAEGVQDVFVMKNSQGTFHMFATGVKDQNVVHGFSRDGKTWTVVDAPVLPMTDGSTTFKTRTHPWIVHVETAYPSPKGRKMTVMTAVTDSSGLQTVVSQDFASVVEKKH